MQSKVTAEVLSAATQRSTLEEVDRTIASTATTVIAAVTASPGGVAIVFIKSLAQDGATVFTSLRTATTVRSIVTEAKALMADAVLLGPVTAFLEVSRPGVLSESAPPQTGRRSTLSIEDGKMGQQLLRPLRTKLL